MNLMLVGTGGTGTGLEAGQVRTAAKREEATGTGRSSLASLRLLASSHPVYNHKHLAPPTKYTCTCALHVIVCIARKLPLSHLPTLHRVWRRGGGRVGDPVHCCVFLRRRRHSPSSSPESPRPHRAREKQPQHSSKKESSLDLKSKQVCV